MARSAAYFEAAGFSERWPLIEYWVWRTRERGYFVRSSRDGVQVGAEKVAVFLAGDIYLG